MKFIAPSEERAIITNNRFNYFVFLLKTDAHSLDLINHHLIITKNENSDHKR